MVNGEEAAEGDPAVVVNPVEAPVVMATSVAIGSVKEFDSNKETWTNYVERLEFFYAANDIVDANKKKSILLSTSGPTTYKIVRSLCSPDSPATKSYNEIKELMQNHMNPNPNVISERYKFNSRDRKPNESIAEYVAEIRRRTEFCNYGPSLSDMLRDRLVCGVNDRKIQLKLLGTVDLTFARAKEIALAMEKSAKDCSSMLKQNGGVTACKPEDDASINVFQQGGNKKKSVGSNYKCFRCNYRNHHSDDCKFREQECLYCHGVGHTARACGKKEADERKKSGKTKKRNFKSKEKLHTYEDDEESTESDGENCNFISALHPLYDVDLMNLDQHHKLLKSEPPLKVTVMFYDTPLLMEVDTGASRSVISVDTFRSVKRELSKRRKANLKLRDSKIKFRTYTGELIPSAGEVSGVLSYGGLSKSGTLQVAPGNGPSLLGRDLLKLFKLDWKSVFAVMNISEEDLQVADEVEKVTKKRLADLLIEYADVFSQGTPNCPEELGALEDKKVHIDMKDEFKPRFYKARPVPYALKDRIDVELNRLIKLGIYTPVASSQWAAPIVPVIKPNGGIRICGDYKLTVNKEAKCDSYPLPTPEDIFATLHGGQKFSKLDLAGAYQQLVLDDSSRKVLTVNTHRGLFQPTRLQYGVHSATALFQREMDQRLAHIPRTTARVDDILTTGTDDKSHLDNLEEIFRTCRRFGLKLNMKKCLFMSDVVEYLGFKVNKEGVTVIEEKVEDILNAPEPKNVSQLKSFLGMLNYYHKYLPNLSTKLEPLHALLRKGAAWQWSDEAKNSFKSAKKMLCSTDLLVHFDPRKKIVLHCDASPYGVGSVLSHIMDDQSEKPIAYHSRALKPAERNYSQIEREALAIVTAVKKFHQYLYGQSFEIVTDHKPLLGLLSESKPIPSMCASRIQRWSLLLAGYDYKLYYRPGNKNNNADCMSRLPVVKDGPAEVNNHIMLMELSKSPVKLNDVQRCSRSDPVIAKVIDMVLSHEKMDSELDPSFAAYKRRIDELVVEEGILMWGFRVVIPKKLRETILEELHEAHPGITRMKALARSYFWWPGMDADIENLVVSCDACQHHQNSPESASMHLWEPVSKPWSRIHLDHAGPFRNKLYLIVVDAFSKWVEVVPVSSTNSSVTIEKLRVMFATHGLPEIIVSDNASGFKSEEYGRFLEKNNIRKIHGAPFHPATNGLAERTVQTFKKALGKMLETNTSKASIQTLISRFLFSYRITPHSVTGITPAEALMNRKLNNVFSMVKPCTDRKSRLMAAKNEDKLTRSFVTGQIVWVRNYANGPRWVKGIVEKQNGPASYEVLVNGNMLHRHVDQMRRGVENESNVKTVILKDSKNSFAQMDEEQDAVSRKMLDIQEEDPVVCDATEEPHSEKPDITEEPTVDEVPVEPATPSNVEPPRRSGRLRGLPSYLSDYVT